VVKQFRYCVADEAALLQPTDVGLEGYRLVAAAEVKAGHVETNPRACTSPALRRTGWLRRISAPRSARWLAGLKFKPHSISKGITLGFLHLDQNILLRIGPFRILHRRIHLAEDAQIVEFGLRVQKILLA